MQNTPIRNKREPFFNNVPPGVLILGGVIGGIELFLQIFGLEWRSAAFLLLAFFPLDFGAPYKELFFAQNLVMFCYSCKFITGFYKSLRSFNQARNISKNNAIYWKVVHGPYKPLKI